MLLPELAAGQAVVAEEYTGRGFQLWLVAAVGIASEAGQAELVGLGKTQPGGEQMSRPQTW